MLSRSSSSFVRYRTARHRRDAAFSLVELSVVVFIISLLAAIAVPTLKQVRVGARSAAVINDLRVFSSAFQTYAQEHSNWPAGDAVPGQFPAGMEGYLNTSNWTHISPIGGLYTWAPNTLQQGERYRAAIIITSVDDSPVTSGRAQLEAIDKAIDDGDLEAGNFRLGFRNYPVYVIEH